MTQPKDIIEELRDRVEELESLLGLRDNTPDPFGLTPTEKKFVGVLLRRKSATKDMLLTAIYGGLSDRDQSNVTVNMKKIRDKLDPCGITVKNRVGVGYYLDDHARSVLKEACAA
jgi:DNA-binding response OmpR family regulator